MKILCISSSFLCYRSVGNKFKLQNNHFPSYFIPFNSILLFSLFFSLCLLFSSRYCCLFHLKFLLMPAILFLFQQYLLNFIYLSLYFIFCFFFCFALYQEIFTNCTPEMPFRWDRWVLFFYYEYFTWFSFSFFFFCLLFFFFLFLKWKKIIQILFKKNS